MTRDTHRGWRGLSALLGAYPCSSSRCMARCRSNFAAMLDGRPVEERGAEARGAEANDVGCPVHAVIHQAFPGARHVQPRGSYEEAPGLRRMAIPESRSRLLAPPPLVARGLSQHKILENEISFASRKWRFALLAHGVAINGFWPGFCLDDLIQRFAVRAEEQWRTVVYHRTPPANFALGDTVARSWRSKEAPAQPCG
jgi:hypothetical protein